MYEDTTLPVRSKFRISSGSKTKLYFIRDSTSRSLYFMKWTEMVLGVFTFFINLNNGPINSTVVIITSSLNSLTIIILISEITYRYFASHLPLLVQIFLSLVNCGLYTTSTILLYQINFSMISVFPQGLTGTVFLVDVICKIIISTYLHQITRVKKVKDVAVSAFIPVSQPPKPKPARSAFTATPITYGGTFPVDKNHPPFLPSDRNPPTELYTALVRQKTSEISYPNDQRTYYMPKLEEETWNSKNKTIQTNTECTDRATTTFAMLHIEEERRKKSPWTCSTPTSSRKIESRRPNSFSTPITYSGTFAVNKELVPITQQSLMISPRISPRSERTFRQIKEGSISRSEGNSPRKLEHISEERLSSENCSLRKTNCTYIDTAILPGSVSDDLEHLRYKRSKISPM